MLTVEELEPRCTPGGVGAKIDCEGVLVIRGTPAADRVTVEVSPELVKVYAGKRWWGFDPAELADIRFEGNGGGDRLTLRVAWPDDSAALLPLPFDWLDDPFALEPEF